MDKPASHSTLSTSTSSQLERSARGGRLRRIFIGGNGIRAGWSALLFIAVFVGVIAGWVWIARHYLPRPPDDQPLPVLNGIVMECIQVGAVMIATAVLAAIERRPLFSFGLQGRARGIRFVSGAVVGFGAISIMVLTLQQAGLLQLNPSSIHGVQVVKYGLIWAVLFFMTGVFEESLLRGYLQYTLTRGIGFWWAALLLSLAFGAIHGINPGETPVGLLTAVWVGLILCLTLWYTGSLWWAIGFHAAWDWGESYFYGTSDSGRLVEGTLFTAHPRGNVLLSGGATGPEGSALIFMLLIVMTISMWAWWRRAGVQYPQLQRSMRHADGRDPLGDPS